MAYIKTIPVVNGGTGLSTTTINQILFSSAANVISGLTTANSGVLVTNSSGVPLIDTTNFAVLSTGVQVKGNNTNTTPPASFIGETVRAYVSNGSVIALTTAVTTSVTSISLTAGIWDVSCLVGFTTSTNAPVSNAIVSISSTQSTIAGNYGDDSVQYNAGTQKTSSQPVLSIPKFRVTLSSTTIYYLVGYAAFTVSTCGIYGRISATRVG